MQPDDLPVPPQPARIAPLPPKESSGDARDFLAFVESPEGLPGASSYHVVQTLARHPDLARRYLGFGLHVRRLSTLPARARELVTLRTAWLYRAAYEWKRHIKTAVRGGHFTEAEIEAIKIGAEAPSWEPFERDLLRAVDQLQATTTLSDDLWQRLSVQFDDRQMLDLLFTVGSYVMLAMVLNATQVQLDADVS